MSSPSRVACLSGRAPVISRTRSWRGLMHVRYDDGLTDRLTFWKQLLLFAPLRVSCGLSIVFGAIYMFLGHDQFLYMMYGYESEMNYEARVNPNVPMYRLSLMQTPDPAKHTVRLLEPPIHHQKEFDIFSSEHLDIKKK